ASSIQSDQYKSRMSSAASSGGKAAASAGSKLLKKTVEQTAATNATGAGMPASSQKQQQRQEEELQNVSIDTKPLSKAVREDIARTFPTVFLRHPALRNVVSGRGEKGLRAVCVNEMLSLLECLNGADYNQRRCTAQIGTFQRCVEVEEAKRRRRKELIKKPETGRSVGGRLAAPQINALLARFPTPPKALGEPEVNRHGRFVLPKK
ncbi:hypothetical protein BOX15_Mlig007517g5, partial [Macrostomum lignano]